MRKRVEIKNVKDIKKDPDFRIVFQKENYQEYMNFLSIGNQYAINPTTLARHLILIFTRKVMNAENKQLKDVLLTEVMQSMHGLMQISMFEKQFNSPINVEAALKRSLLSTMKPKQMMGRGLGTITKPRKATKPKGEK